MRVERGLRRSTWVQGGVWGRISWSLVTSAATREEIFELCEEFGEVVVDEFPFDVDVAGLGEAAWEFSDVRS